ncbi:MAG: tRNA (guanosine(46)-N7)-methyltransferase TrmB [Acetobacter sp.]|nr:tRNA (guanosine(46)-N7)-methyltransferase TrmB [Bacteroides sp.]MCM1340912.1 tRNA (guanosine(46)-N7)-methyltransferase TrmB [Acetobacter sp.]MCM1432532.1 tRNA (guanosine(46)-N7)-methyltransferase TrmB [Clostridiales bacterium]
MRMKRKKNLDERINASSDYLTIMKNDSLNFNDAAKENHLIDLKNLFGNDKPVYLEIGSGKGQFGCTFAKLNPDKNILCVERNRNVLILAIDSAREMGLDNIKFLCGTAEYLLSYIEEKSIEEIYLNFSCPFPKNKHVAHRLTNPHFLEIYKRILKPYGAICQKTDNMHFFEYSLEAFSSCSFKLSNISLDLHNSDFDGNIVTEYENKFASQGYPIYRLEARM